MSWVGGDIPGLQAMGSAMAQATNKTSDIVKTLNSRVDTLASDAEWKGTSADAFRKVWSDNSVEIGILNSTVTQAGTTIKKLADGLQDLEDKLHNVAAKYSAKGVPIGANGEPQAVVVSGDASASPAKDVLQAAKEYKELYDSYMMLAKGVRSEAANSLSDLLSHALTPTAEKPGQGVKPDARVTAEDYLRGLLAAPDETKRDHAKLGQELRDARQRFKATRGPLQAAKAEYAAKGLNLPANNDARLAHSDALKELNAAADKFGNAAEPKWVMPGSDWLNFKLGDLAKSGSLVKTFPEKLGFLKDVPVLDIGATIGISGLQASSDMDKGRSFLPAVGSQGLAGLAGLGAGAAAFALAPAAAPELLVAAGAGALVVGVGNIGSAAANEHWMEDIQSSGVVAGLAEGFGHAVAGGISETGNQVASIWHGIFG